MACLNAHYKTQLINIPIVSFFKKGNLQHKLTSSRKCQKCYQHLMTIMSLNKFKKVFWLKKQRMKQK